MVGLTFGTANLIAAASDVIQATSVDLKTNLAAVFLKGGIVLHV